MLGFHPFFVSMTELRHRPAEKKLEISVRVFTDDLEKDLAKECQCKTDLLDPGKHPQMEVILKKYLDKVLKIKANGQTLKPTWVGFEQEEESTWSYLEVENMPGIQSLVVENEILFFTQPKQVNLVRFKTDNKDQTRQLRYPQNTVTF